MAQSQREITGHIMLSPIAAVGWLLWLGDFNVDKAIGHCPPDPWWKQVHQALLVIKQEEENNGIRQGNKETA